MNVEGSTEVIAPYETNFCRMTSTFSLNLFPYVWNRNNNNMYFSELWELSENELDVKKNYNYCYYTIPISDICFSSDYLSITEKVKNIKVHTEEKVSIISPPR